MNYLTELKENEEDKHHYEVLRERITTITKQMAEDVQD
jgi:hypothetical protein